MQSDTITRNKSIIPCGQQHPYIAIQALTITCPSTFDFASNRDKFFTLDTAVMIVYLAHESLCSA